MKTLEEIKEQVARIEASGAVYKEIAELIDKGMSPINIAKHCSTMIDMLHKQIKIINGKEIPECLKSQHK